MHLFHNFTVCISQYREEKSHRCASDLWSTRCSPERSPPRTYLVAESNWRLQTSTQHLAPTHLESRSQRSQGCIPSWEEFSSSASRQPSHSWVCTCGNDHKAGQWEDTKYFMMVLRSFFIVLPVSMMSSTIKTFFPAKFSKLSRPAGDVKIMKYNNTGKVQSSR